MRSTNVTAAARIREAAMQLFADRGAAAVTIRDIAGAAEVSPGLVIHHYKSKHGLRAAVDERVLAILSDFVADLLDPAAANLETTSMARLLAERLEEYPVLPAYLRRMLVDGGEPAQALFSGLVQMSLASMHESEQAGALRPSEDPLARTAFLVVNDLGTILLREQITAVLEQDPLSRGGVTRWTEQVMDVYSNGLYKRGKEPQS